MYEVPPPKYSVERIQHILHIPDDKVCKEKPTNIKKSSTFVVDTRNLKSLYDIKKDEFRIWSYSGSQPQTFRIHYENEQEDVFTVKRCPVSAKGSNVVHLRWLYCVHPSNKM